MKDATMPSKTQQSQNRLLAALPEHVYSEVLPKLERFELIYDQDIYKAGDVIRHVYFPESGIISLLAVVGSDSTLEVGIVGDEGMIGIPIFLGETISNYRAVVQGAGFAMRMTAADFRDISDRGGELAHILKRFTFSLMTQISQSAACNRYHPINARLARWLLLSHDRLDSDKLVMTHDLISNMLGVRREGVTLAAQKLAVKKLIKNVRGTITVLDRQGLEAAVCECYEVVNSEYNRLLGRGISRTFA